MLCLGLLLPHSCVFTFCPELSWPYKSVCTRGLCQSPISGLFKPLSTQLWCSWVDPHTEERTKVHFQVAEANLKFLCMVNPCTTFFHFSTSLPSEDALANGLLRISKSHTHWNHTPEWPELWVRRAKLAFQIIHNLFVNWTGEETTQLFQKERFKSCPEDIHRHRQPPTFVRPLEPQWPSLAKPFVIFFLTWMVTIPAKEQGDGKHLQEGGKFRDPQNRTFRHHSC